jgi:hypothetical protein
MGHFPCEIPGGLKTEWDTAQLNSFAPTIHDHMFCGTIIQENYTFKFHPHLQENKILRTLAEGVPSSANIWIVKILVPW